jgi:hypothetical protein
MAPSKAPEGALEDVMLGLVKMSALSAILSVGVVATYSDDTVPVDTASTGKLYHDRVLPEGEEPLTVGSIAAVTSASPVVDRSRKGDRLTGATPDGCSARGGASAAVACVSGSKDRQPSRRSRVITVETRDVPDVSVLWRVTATDIAQR